MDDIDRRTLLRAAGAGTGVPIGATAAGAEDSVEAKTGSRPAGGTTQVVSSVSASIDRIGLAVDTDDPSAVEEIPASDFSSFDVFAEMDGEIESTAQWASTSATVPDLVDLVDLLLSTDPKGRLVDFFEQLDIQADIIDAYDLDELTEQLVSFLEQLDADETQAAAIRDLLNAVQEALQIDLPFGLSLGDLVENLLLNPGELDQVLTQLGIETMADLVDTVIGSIDGVETIADLEQYLVDLVSGFDFDNLVDILSIGVELDELSGQFDPRLGDPAGMTVELDTVTLLVEVDTVGPGADAAVEVPLGLTLTTGESGQRTGSISLDPAAGDGGEGQATAVDNEFTLDVGSLPLTAIVENIDLVALVEAVLALLEVDPADYEWELSQLVADMDIPSLVENADIPGLLGDLITDEPGRHVFEADLDMSFGDLESVLEMDLPGELPSGGLPRDIDGDGLFEDVNGDGQLDIFDVQVFFENLDSESVQQNTESFDFEGDGQVNIFDVQALFERL